MLVVSSWKTVKSLLEQCLISFHVVRIYALNSARIFNEELMDGGHDCAVKFITYDIISYV